MQQLSTGFINRHVKFNWGITEFCNYYSVTQDEFKEIFDKTFFGKTNRDLWRKISKNSSKTTTATSVLLESTKDLTTTYEPDGRTLATSEEGTLTTSEERTDESKISSLESSRNDLALLICNMEENHVALKAKRKEAFNSLATHQKWITEFYEALKSHSEEVTQLSLLTMQLSDEMKQLSSEIAVKKQELASLDREIALSKKVVILAYSNGEMDLDNTCEEIPDTWESLYCILRDYEIAEDLKVKEIKQVAKILALVTKLNEDKIPFEVTFENEISEQLFNEYTRNS